jgi:HEAT repeat protein/Mg-chelatase subunit ChlD
MCSLRAQDDVVARYHKLQREPGAQRVPLAAELTAVPGARAAALIRQDLANSDSKRLRLALLAGLAKHARPELAAAVAEVLRPSDPDRELARAAGTALAQMGEAGANALGDVVARFGTGRSDHREREGVQQSLLDALGTMQGQAALSVLAGLARKGHASDRARALGKLGNAPGDYGVHEARTEALMSDHAPLVLAGLRQIAAHAEPQLVAAMTAVAARADGPLRAPLLSGLAQVAADKLRPELHALFFTAAAASDPTLSRDLGKHAAKLRADHALARFVLSRLPGWQNASERALAARLLAALPEATAALVELSQAREPIVADAAIAALGARRHPDATPALRKLLASPGDERRRMSLQALHTILRGDDAWHEELRALAAEPALRVLAIDLLADVRDEAFLPAAHKFFVDPDWRVRAAAYDFCRGVRDAASIPLLIARLAQEQARMRQDVLDALAALSGLDLHTDRQWQDWWQDHADGFAVSAALPAAKRPRTDPDANSTRTYYSIPVVSAAVIFVVDRSGSMREKIGTGGSTRLDEAKRQIVRVLQGTPNGHRVGVVAFDGEAQALHDKLVRIDDKTRAELSVRVEMLRIGRATNVHDGMQTAFADPDVDTIYLLTDGAPTVGPITDPVELRAAIASWNRTRRIKIHTVSVGTESEFMRGVAEDAGGKYASVK